MKTVILIVAALLAAVPALAQVPAPTPTPAPASPVRMSGSVTTGVEQFDNSTNSSKLAEYRDLRDDFYLPRVTFNLVDPGGTAFSLSGTNISRDDQTILADVGKPGIWNVFGYWNEIPHNLSNKALTAYIERSPGVFGLPATVPITFKRLATSTADDAVQVMAMDALVAAYQRTFLGPAPLAVQNNAGRFGFDWNAANALNVAVVYDRRDRSGYKWGFGPIGDRPPRTLNVQLTEPVDHETGNLQFAAEHQGRGYRLRGEYEFSDFANGIDTLRWQNLYTTAAPGADFDVWDRLVATTGARPLAPDNRAHLVTGHGGVDVPGEGRVTAQISYGVMEQDMALLPYSTFPAALANNRLPRSGAAAEMVTKHFAADYVVNPLDRVNVRAFFRTYDLDNNTPSDRWQYVTSDTSNMNGTVNYVNKRVSVPYAWDRQNGGIDATFRLAGRSSLLVGWEREAIGRVHREADTAENVLRLTLRSKPSRWVGLRARFLQGVRDGTEYDNAVTREGYWYDLSEATDNNNPKLTFDNHPDMRRFDVSDRNRRQFDFTVNLTPRDIVSVSAFVRYRRDDFDSDVTATQPLAETTLADRTATTPGDQLGLLENKRTRFGVEVFAEPTARASFNAFLNYDLGASFMRSLEFNENNKANPSAINTAELGPWTRLGSQWTADADDTTWSGGFGTAVQVVPNRLALFADYTLSLTNYELVYGGYGVTNFNGTPFPANHQFAFSTPEDVQEDLHVFNVRVEIPIRSVALVVGYAFETYNLIDWQQSSSQPWVEAVGAETFLRDTSRSFQWGNRLFNLGTYLAPSYDAHIGFVGLRYRF